jgi:hypothetical protein
MCIVGVAAHVGWAVLVTFCGFLGGIGISALGGVGVSLALVGYFGGLLGVPWVPFFITCTPYSVL